MTGTTLEPRSLDAVLDHVTRELDPGASACEVLWATVDGERVVVKVAAGRSRAALRREAEALERIGASGLVTLVRLHESDTVTAVVMADAGQRTLEHPGDATAETLLRALQHACHVVDDLHRAGWCHGRLMPGHVIVGPRGRVRLCSLGAARPTSDRPDGVSADLLALRELLGHVAAELEERGGHARTARRLRRIAADRTEHDDHLGAAALAEQVATLHRSGPAPPRWSFPWPDGPRPRWLAGIGVACAALAIGAAAMSVPLPRAGGVSTPPDTVEDLASTLPIGPPTTSIDETSTTSPTIAPAPVGPPPTAVLDGATYRVGLPGDLVVTGDWNCDGAPTVRVLRPATGELFEVAPDRVAGRTSTGSVLRVVDGATGLRAERSRDPGVCDRTVVRRADGTDQVVP